MVQDFGSILVFTESLNEIMADKIVAFPTSVCKIDNGSIRHTPERIRHRDIWDIAWLIQKGATIDINLIKQKVDDYGVDDYLKLIDQSQLQMERIISGSDFRQQMARFIKKSTYDKLIADPEKLGYFSNTIREVLSSTSDQINPNANLKTLPKIKY